MVQAYHIISIFSMGSTGIHGPAMPQSKLLKAMKQDDHLTPLGLMSGGSHRQRGTAGTAHENSVHATLLDQTEEVKCAKSSCH